VSFSEEFIVFERVKNAVDYLRIVRKAVLLLNRLFCDQVAIKLPSSGRGARLPEWRSFLNHRL